MSNLTTYERAKLRLQAFAMLEGWGIAMTDHPTPQSPPADSVTVPRGATQTKAAFEAFIREYRRPDIGDDANDLTEADFVLDLAEDGWPDADLWCDIWMRIKDGGELTPREREQSVVYYRTEDGDDVPEQFRLAAAPAISPVPDVTELTLAWRDGAPPKPWRDEWFIAILTNGDGRVVLRSLPEEYTYDFKTADETYFKKDRIKKWMQFPDSEFIAPDVTGGSDAEATVQKAFTDIEYLFDLLDEWDGKTLCAEIEEGGFLEEGTIVASDFTERLETIRECILALRSTPPPQGCSEERLREILAQECEKDCWIETAKVIRTCPEGGKWEVRIDHALSAMRRLSAPAADGAG